MNWEHVKIFLTVAEEGSLTGAAEGLGLSPPTIARRINRFEQTLGVRLFSRRHDGYQLTQNGRALLAEAASVRDACEAFNRLASAKSEAGSARVRLASGYWFSRLITERMNDFHAKHPLIEIELVTGHAVADLDSGEADISIRNMRPAGGDLIMRKLGDAKFAIYGSKDYVAQHPEAFENERYAACDWIGASSSLQRLASQVWLRARLTKEPVLKCSQTLQFLDAVKSGVGLTVLPRVIGDSEAQLCRVSADIALEHDEIWLVVHENLQKAPAVRAVIDWLVPLFKSLAT